jgi:hypothetical protein
MAGQDRMTIEEVVRKVLRNEHVGGPRVGEGKPAVDVDHLGSSARNRGLPRRRR